jgi:type VI secretion system protein ImpM
MSRPTVKKPATVPGWFGKIPNLGDFASRRLPNDFVHHWDHWLQTGLAQARSDLGQAWQGIYLVAPILRFWVGPGTVGNNGAWAGLVMPSVDRVGRHFPLTLARPFASLAAALAAREWFAALDRAARRVLDVDFTLDDLESELLKVSLVDAGVVRQADAALASILMQRCAGAHQPCSLWWHGDGDDEAAFLGFAGLPPATDFISMLGVTA